MAIYGRDIREDDDVLEPRRLKEVSLQFAAADLRRIAAFLIACADEMEAGAFLQGHSHLRDGDRGWGTAHPNCDVIVIPPGS